MNSRIRRPAPWARRGRSKARGRATPVRRKTFATYFVPPRPPSITHEVWHRHQHDADDQGQPRARHEPRIDHQRDAAYQRHDHRLLLAIDEIADADGAEQHAPQQRGGTWHGITPVRSESCAWPGPLPAASPRLAG